MFYKKMKKKTTSPDDNDRNKPDKSIENNSAYLNLLMGPSKEE